MSVDPIAGPGVTMDCAALVRSLDVWLDGELDASDEAAAQEHVTACEPCRALAASEERARAELRRRLRAALGDGSVTAPVQLRARVGRALAQCRRTRRMARVAPVAGLALVLAAAVGLLAHGRGGDPRAVLDDAVRDHARELPLEVSAAGVEPSSEPVTAWFAGKLDFRPELPRFDGGAVRLVGARLHHLRDLPAAYLRSEMPEGHLGLFVAEDRDHRLDAALPALAAGADRPQVISARGYSVAVWRHRDLVYSLVSDVGERRLSEIVGGASGTDAR
jgi:anti-sigma factor (TIGR02949 family)